MTKSNIFQLHIFQFFNNLSSRFLTLLLFADLLFIILHSLTLVPNYPLANFILSEAIFEQKLLLITEDQSYAEVFQYLKEFWIMLLLYLGYWRQRQAIFLIWGLLFGYLLLDDSLIIHEKMGGVLSNLLNLQPAFNLRSVDFGELIFSSVIGAIFLILISWRYQQSDAPVRKFCKNLIFLLLALAISGIVLDLIQVGFSNTGRIGNIFALLEDGGEHIVMSCILAFVYSTNWEIL
ncbi:MAG: hypothetical protein AAFQ91_31305 [Cyanobacteria bacterium J06621_15]